MAVSSFRFSGPWVETATRIMHDMVMGMPKRQAYAKHHYYDRHLAVARKQIGVRYDHGLLMVYLLHMLGDPQRMQIHNGHQAVLSRLSLLNDRQRDTLQVLTSDPSCYDLSDAALARAVGLRNTSTAKGTTRLIDRLVDIADVMGVECGRYEVRTRLTVVSALAFLIEPNGRIITFD